MRLSWNEIRVRAVAFAKEWADAVDEKRESQSFYNDFFNIFGMKRRKVASFEEPVKKLDNKHGFIDLFWKGVLLVEQKSAGRDLVRAKEQAFSYFPGLKNAELPRYILVSDFQNFELFDLETSAEIKFPLAELPKNIEHFGFILGLEKRVFKDQEPVNIAASELMANLHDELKASGYDSHDLERFLVRLVFCLFADDTGIFERGIFTDLVEQCSFEDGSDLGRLLNEFFEVLNTPEEKRQKMLDEQLNAFPYINGNLFRERLGVANFDTKTRKALLEACDFDWGQISPAIFGSLFQSVMDKKERRNKGAHYTSEQNIMKLIQPLFLDNLQKEFEVLCRKRGNDKKEGLRNFHDKLAKMTFFDPACGCGNFLIIAYRELRKLETVLLQQLFDENAPRLDIANLSKLNVDRFYGIEISEFPARIAEVALWLMDHMMNVELGNALGQVYARIPLRATPHICHADALEVDWQSILPSEQCSYVLGNPPFIGAKMQSAEQRAQVRAIANLSGSGGTLDYVCAWFLKAGEYIQKGSAQIGFVATNSITQGEQVAQLWPLLFDRYKLEISFAHRTFAWGSEARSKAHVHVVIIGLAKRGQEPQFKRLFSYSDVNGNPTETLHNALTAYLFGAENLANAHSVVKETTHSLMGQPKLIIGSKPIDGGHYIFTDAEKSEFLKQEPQAESLFRPYIGAEEFINGGHRWILSLQKTSPTVLAELALVRRCIEKVRQYRLKSLSKPTQKLAEKPRLYHVNVLPQETFLVIPEVSTERRDYVPIGWLEPPTIPSNLLKVLENANLWHFAILTSTMHMAWLRYIGGRLGSGYRYSAGLVYNTFPWPDMNKTQEKKVGQLAQAILDARTKFPDSSLAELYDPDLMPPLLRKAHQALDRAVDKLYRLAGFETERDRIEHLLALYEKLTDPLLAKEKKPKRRKKSIG